MATFAIGATLHCAAIPNICFSETQKSTLLTKSEKGGRADATPHEVQ